MMGRVGRVHNFVTKITPYYQNDVCEEGPCIPHADGVCTDRCGALGCVLYSLLGVYVNESIRSD